MAINAMIAQTGGGLNQAVGQYYQAQGQKTALKLQARMNEINAKITEGQARDTLMRGERQEQAARMSAAQLKSTQRTALAAQGMELGSETAAAIQTSTDYLSEMDVNTIRANALREAWGYRMEATNLRGEAAVTRATARGIDPAGQALGSLLTSAAEIGGSYASFKQSGALGSSVDKFKASKSPISRGIGSFFGRGL